MKRAFTMLEMMMAVFILGVITTLSVLTFNAVSSAWQVSTDYLDKMQRTDFALSQVVGALRSMYYPHDGKVDERYGFVLVDNGKGEDPDSSDVIEWSKMGKAIVGNKSSVADTVHRVQVMILEEGDTSRDWPKPIEQTGLYARLCPDVALRPEKEDVDFSFSNDKMYAPVLISASICGFNCRVISEKDTSSLSADDAENDVKKFEDTFDKSNSVPYKVELSFKMVNSETRSYQSGPPPMVKIIRIPIHEQSLDGSPTPTDEETAPAGSSTRGPRGR
ncbi:MAG: type II secretion system protein [Kiritimatiellae bacterium]|nr:type II secretion system protein [Kiritimatiellia bacterium]